MYLSTYHFFHYYQLYYYLDYYFPELRIAVELDSELHVPEKDRIRDKYLERLGIGAAPASAS